jgi:hypothetical protein
MRKFALFILGATVLFAQKQSVLIDINDNDLEGGYELISPIGSDTNLYYGITISRLMDEFDKMRLLGNFHVDAIGATPFSGLSAKIGLKAVVASVERGAKDEYPFALPLEIGLIYTLPIALRTHIAAFYDIAPTALCFNDCDRFTELRFEAGIEPIEGGMLFVGWRKIELRDEGWKYELNKAAYIGVRVSF